MFSTRSKLGAAAVASVAVAAIALPGGASAAHGRSDHHGPGDAAGRHDHDGRGDDHGHGAIRHVLLISVDGLHQSDLRWFIRHNPGSTLAALAARGAEYAHAQTPVPSDSDPGLCSSGHWATSISNSGGWSVSCAPRACSTRRRSSSRPSTASPRRTPTT